MLWESRSHDYSSTGFLSRLVCPTPHVRVCVTSSKASEQSGFLGSQGMFLNFFGVLTVLPWYRWGISSPGTMGDFNLCAKA